MVFVVNQNTPISVFMKSSTQTSFQGVKKPPVTIQTHDKNADP